MLLQARLDKWIGSPAYVVRIVGFRYSGRSFIGKTCSQNASWCVCVCVRARARARRCKDNINTIMQLLVLRMWTVVQWQAVVYTVMNLNTIALCDMTFCPLHQQTITGAAVFFENLVYISQNARSHLRVTLVPA